MIMVQRIVFLLVLIIFLFFPTPVNAHLPGQPPFFKINGELSILYPLYTTSIYEFVLPQDLDVEPRLVNQQLEFEIDTSKLPVPEEVVKQSTFIWDFGDGTTGSGLKNTHTYKKMGSYILKIDVKSPDSPQTQLLQSVLINVIPNKNYQLPKAVILVDGQPSKDPLTDVKKVDFKSEVNFSAKSSQSSSQITSYFWDFGDGTTGDKAEMNHLYDARIHQYFPLLRIKTADGFIADAFVEVQGDELTATNSSSAQTNLTNKYPFIIAGAVILALVAWKKLKKRK